MALDGTGAQRKIQTELVVMPPISANAAVDSYLDIDFQGNLNISGHDECHPGMIPNQFMVSVLQGQLTIRTAPRTLTAQTRRYPRSQAVRHSCPGCPLNHDVPTMINQ